MKQQEAAFINYQFVVLVAVIVFLGYQMWVDGEYVQMLLGGLLGMMVGLSPQEQNKEEEMKPPDVM